MGHANKTRLFYSPRGTTALEVSEMPPSRTTLLSETSSSGLASLRGGPNGPVSASALIVPEWIP